ncbi:integrin alpha-PS3-like isoform X1 [Photinus pyralis]|uniref:integrin alpha-PS3-like isoform X1 n=1 Tax=Photinus pyralis TaxID=7054 RepID=UPI0012671B0E|nr:integrin alpha-PS3-like isoform X1 [Photinus pyralis]
MFSFTALSLILNLMFVVSFNFDTDYPIVYVNPLQNQQRAAYFGYSVVLHGSPSWVQVGSPRGNSSEINAFEPGVIFKCDIYGPCSLIDVDTQTGIGATFRGSFRDKKDKAWIGGAMDIDHNSNRIVVCSHRWVNDRIQDYWMLGACYWAPSNNETLYDKLVPLLDNGKGIVFDRTAKVNVYYYGQGQAGMSAHFTKNPQEAELLLGAPGVYNWDGTTLLYRDGPDSAPVASKLQILPNTFTKREIGYSDFSDLNIANAMTTTQTAAFGLFGYSVTSGYFFNSTELLYVAGAPRSRNLVGQILVYQFLNASDQALDVKDSKQGYQYGEYFGATLCAGDINEDGYDDLIIGAPFYTSTKYNEGRIFVFLGSGKGSLETPQIEFIEGKGIGGQFGSCIMFLGDIHRDGYSDIAVGAPYENEGSGAIYIYRGNSYGLSSSPSQRIAGKDFVPNILGFGISISKPTDVDMNKYNDLAVGAYLSGHVVLIRSKPVVTLQLSVISLTPRLEHNAEFFSIKSCFWYTGFFIPPTISVTRKVVVDELFQRAMLPPQTPSVKPLTLKVDDIVCENITFLIQKDLTNRYDPITVTVSQELIIAKTKREVIYVQQNESVPQDKFCKDCAILNPIRSVKEQKLELSFVLGCGADNICRTKLNLKATFLNINSQNKYVLGSTDYLKLKVNISNEGDKAYLTQLIVELPRLVHFRSIPINCLEGNSSGSIICNVDNPLYEKKWKLIMLDLDMKELISSNYGDPLDFQFILLTSSENMNNNIFKERLYTTREADMHLTGKSGEQSFTYSNSTHGTSNFTQTYQIEKFGVSTIDEILLEIKIPTHVMYKGNLIRMVQLYAPEGYHANQPIICSSNVHYIVENVMDQFSSELDIEDGKESDESYITTTTESANAENLIVDNTNQFFASNPPLLRKQRDVEFDITAYPLNRTLFINCSHPDLEYICARVSCTIGPFKGKQQATTALQLKMFINVSSISEILGKKDIILFTTDGELTIRNPKNFEQSGIRPDTAHVTSTFIGETTKESVDTWIIVAAAIAGLLLLLLLTMALVKAGFFQRTKKAELAALKEAEGANQFQQDTHVPDENDEEMNFEVENTEYETSNYLK